MLPATVHSKDSKERHPKFRRHHGIKPPTFALRTKPGTVTAPWEKTQIILHPSRWERFPQQLDSLSTQMHGPSWEPHALNAPQPTSKLDDGLAARPNYLLASAVASTT